MTPRFLSFVCFFIGTPIFAQTPEPTFYGIQKGLYYVQKSAQGPTLGDDRPARFESVGESAGSLRLPSGTVLTYPAINGVDQRFATATAMDAAFPAGTYTLAVGAVTGISMSMPANPYPAEIPQVLNGTWNSSGRLVVDVTKDYTLVFNTFSNYGPPNGVSGSNVHIYLVGDEDNDLITVQRSTLAGEPSFTTVTIPAGTLVAGRNYTCETSRFYSPVLNTTSVSGQLGVVVGIYEMDFEIAAMNPPNSAPKITAEPVSRSIAPGGTVVFSVGVEAFPEPTYQWRRDGVAIPGATRSTLVLDGSGAFSPTAGSYSCVVSNSLGSSTSAGAVLSVASASLADPGRLINGSILAGTGPGASVLTVGAVVGGTGSTGTLPLLLRGIGPTLGGSPYNVPGVLADPTISVFQAGNGVPSRTSDDWGGTSALVEAFTAVGAFSLPPTSLDSAALLNQPAGGFTVQVGGKGNASGVVLAELYEASAGTRTASSPRLINFSTRSSIPLNGSITAGFVLGGSSTCTVLVRAAGPTLAGAPFGVPGTLSDPRLELFDSTGKVIAANDNWTGAPWLTATQSRVGAFPLSGSGSKDSALLITLAPGAYTARASGLNGSSGTAIIEVYEVP